MDHGSGLVARDVSVVEELGSELITNGTMELNSGWTDYGTPTINVQSAVQKKSGLYSRQFRVNASDEGIYGATFTTVTGKTYVYNYWIYPDDGTTVKVNIRRGDNSGWSIQSTSTNLIENAWNNITGYFIESAGGSGAYISINSGTQTSGDFYVDNISVKEVTNGNHGTITGATWTVH